MKFRVYTDGSTRGNGQENAVGGWAYAVVNDEYNSLVSGTCMAVVGTTNQRMELTAAIYGLKEVERLLEDGETATIITDSAYLQNCYKQKWYRNWQKNGWKNAKKQPVANQDLWEQLIPYFESDKYSFEKVKGHANNSTVHEIWNDYVDELAQNISAAYKENNNVRNSNTSL